MGPIHLSNATVNVPQYHVNTFYFLNSGIIPLDCTSCKYKLHTTRREYREDGA